MNLPDDQAHQQRRNPVRLAIFGSGTGSNAEAIIRWSTNKANDAPFVVTLIVSTAADAGINRLSSEYAIPLVVVPRSMDARQQTASICEALQHCRIDLIALAGYLRMVPRAVIQAVHGHVLNVHPSLLPAYGGKGMYGMAVHSAVVAAREPYTGASIHRVNERYDEGEILAQEEIAVLPADDAQALAKRVLAVEHALYPRTIATYCVRTFGTSPAGVASKHGVVNP